jgi:hypothetical protein
MKKLTEKDFRQLTKPLPLRERERLKRTEMTPEWLEGQIAYAKQEMKNDVYLGIPWLIFYSISLIQFGLTSATIAIFCLGAAYFIYVVIKRGNYGLLRKKVQVFEKILEHLS